MEHSAAVDDRSTPERSWPNRPVIVAGLCALVVALLGGAATDTGPWYQDLAKSSLNPPDVLFAPAWTVIYALLVAATVIGWRALAEPRERAWLVSLLFANGVLNVLWSVCFFTLRRPDWALAEVFTLWVSVLALILFFLPRSRRAATLLVPYLVWVAFAAYLNFRVVVLNGPFA